jgi:hypothetical protein
MTERDYSNKDAKIIRDFIRNKLDIPSLYKHPRKFIKWFLTHERKRIVYVEKSPRNSLRIPYIHAVLPRAKFIHIVRDGRDVTCSMLPGIGGTQWKHTRPDNWRALFSLPSAERSALTWKEIVNTIDQDLRKLPLHLSMTVLYEDLLRNPIAVAHQILRFLDLRLVRKVEDFSQKIQNKTKDSYQPAMSDRWFRNNHTVRIGRWRENLSSSDQEKVHALISNTLQCFGYLD